MRQSNGKIALYLGLVFASGLVVGGFGHRLYTVKSVSATSEAKKKTPDDYRREYMAEMKQRLTLNDKQSKDLEVILDATRAKYKAFRERTKPEMDAIQSAQTEAINALLDETQRKEYALMRAEREAKRREGRH
jgi:uncharacterized protein YeaO (DUF488 family)